ncbi:MAG: tripartite tricarboxylate transporter permease [Hyphomicrobiaceae bacterium]
MEQLLEGLILLLNWQAFLAMTVGTILGLIVGAIPGVGPVQLLPLSLPFTFAMQPVPALLFLLGEFVGGIYGGSISAILVNTPGTPSSIATTFDGYPMARQGKAGKALRMALVGSVVGDIVATTVLIVLAERLARLALAFGPPELVGVILLSLTLVVSVEKTSLTKGFIAAAIGGLLALVGSDSITGTSRFVFGIPALLNGVGIVPLLMGLFSISEILLLAERRLLARDQTVIDLGNESRENRSLSFAEIWQTRGAMGRGCLVGVVIGILPGLGSSAAAMLAYGFARRGSTNPEAFGKGSLEGIAAPETANNAETSGALLPFFVLGIPGSSLVAILGGAFLMHGLDPGPQLFQQHGDKMYAIYCGLYAVNLVLLVVGFFCMGLFHYIVRVPRDILLAGVLLLAVVGTYAIESSLTDVWLMIFFGFAGYGMRKVGVPVSPLLIAYLLVPILEHNFRQTLLISGGSYSIFFERPAAATILAAAIGWIAWCMISPLWRARRADS